VPPPESSLWHPAGSLHAMISERVGASLHGHCPACMVAEGCRVNEQSEGEGEGEGGVELGKIGGKLPEDVITRKRGIFMYIYQR
jgi:hypothetical protein